MWFRQDLRLSDNPALTAAVAANDTLAVYILDDINSQDWKMGAASRWWLHHSLQALNDSLQGNLLVLAGDPLQLLPHLAESVGATQVHWNRCYEPWRIARDKALKEHLNEMSIEVTSHKAALLWEPWEVKKKDGTPYQVFTPFYRKGCLQAATPATPIAAPKHIAWYPELKRHDLAKALGKQGIDALALLPSIPWDRTMQDTWQIGEHAAQKRLESFLEQGLENYKEGRNFPERNNVSRLSPHFHFGEISPQQAWIEAQRAGLEGQFDDDLDCFQSEIGWREFSNSLLYYKPDLPVANLQKKFDRFPWANNKTHLEAWQKGMTGYPLVDAGMRELWQTGYMHNRVRMVVGSFLVKNLLMHWHHGEAWFWDCLVDADLAANSASWQWIAGCGADAAPYFRVFNPVTQSERFDAKATYIRKYVPEIATLPNKYIHNPSAAPQYILDEAGVQIGKDYPKAIVELKRSRERALEAFKSL